VCAERTLDLLDLLATPPGFEPGTFSLEGYLYHDDINSKWTNSRFVPVLVPFGELVLSTAPGTACRAAFGGEAALEQRVLTEGKLAA
jgi:hypothetical protein